MAEYFGPFRPKDGCYNCNKPCILVNGGNHNEECAIGLRRYYTGESFKVARQNILRTMGVEICALCEKSR